MEVLDNDGKIIFLRKLKEGPAAESYGIHVAKLAGLSDTILGRASQILRLLKERDFDLTETFHNEKVFQHKKDAVNRKNDIVNNEKSTTDLSIITQGKIDKLLREIEPEQITPLEALNLLCQWKKIVGTENRESEKMSEKKQKSINKETDKFPSLFD